MNRKTLAAAAMTTALATGGVLGATLGAPTISGAQDTTTSTEGSTTTTAPSTDTTTADSTAAPDAGMGHRGGPGRGFDLDVAAETLGMTVEELRTALSDGSTLAEVAEAQGVDRQTLVDALVAAAEARLEEAKAELPDRIGELVDSTLPARGEGGPGGSRGGPGLDAAAEALDMTVDELRSALSDGSTLAEVAEAQGVDRQALIDALVAAGQERLDQAVADGKLTQAEADERAADLEARVTERIDSTLPAGGFGGRGPGHDDSASDSDTDDSTTTTTTG